MTVVIVDAETVPGTMSASAATLTNRNLFKVSPFLPQ
jgi:hypothetical protein